MSLRAASLVIGRPSGKSLREKSEVSIDHRSHQSLKRASNRFLAKKWDEREYILHRGRLANVKASVDDRAPPAYVHLQVKLRSLQVQEERLALVERNNRILLERMSHIMRTKGYVDNLNDYVPKSLNKLQRQQDILRITHENRAILKRILTTQPATIRRDEWERDFRKHIVYVNDMASYPYGWWRKAPTKKNLRKLEKNFDNSAVIKVNISSTPKRPTPPPKDALRRDSEWENKKSIGIMKQRLRASIDAGEPLNMNKIKKKKRGSKKVRITDKEKIDKIATSGGADERKPGKIEGPIQEEDNEASDAKTGSGSEKSGRGSRAGSRSSKPTSRGTSKESKTGRSSKGSDSPRSEQKGDNSAIDETADAEAEKPSQSADEEKKPSPEEDSEDKKEASKPSLPDESTAEKDLSLSTSSEVKKSGVETGDESETKGAAKTGEESEPEKEITGEKSEVSKLSSEETPEKKSSRESSAKSEKGAKSEKTGKESSGNTSDRDEKRTDGEEESSSGSTKSKKDRKSSAESSGSTKRNSKIKKDSEKIAEV